VQAVESSLAGGGEALLRAAWAEARSYIAAALVAGESVEALEGLGVAARWQMDGRRSSCTSARAAAIAWAIAHGVA